MNDKTKRQPKFPRAGAKFERLLQAIQDGNSYKHACALAQLSYGGFRKAVANDEKFKAKIEQARANHSQDMLNVINGVISNPKAGLKLKLEGAIKMLDRADKQDRNSADQYIQALVKAQQKALENQDFDLAKTLARQIEQAVQDA